MDTKAKMDPRIKEEWVKRLRSGEYEQGQGVLKDIDDTYCCLGVLASIYLDEHNKGWRFEECYDRLYLPKAIVNWAGLSNYYNDININDKCSLVSMNDEGCSFEEIADVIEENL